MLGALVAIVVALVVKVPFFSMRGLHMFGVLHLIYVDLVVLLPAMGMAVLAWGWFDPRLGPVRRLTTQARIAAWSSLMAVGVGIYATYIEPARLQLETATIDVDPARVGREALRIAILSDIQLERVTDYERQAVERLLALRPDVIVMPGDVFQGTARRFEDEVGHLRELLGRLDAPGGVFLVRGDVDWNDDHVHRMVQGTRIRLLENEVVRTNVRDRRITIGGVELNYGSNAAQAVVRQLEDTAGTDEIRILLGHRPDVALGLRERSRIDMVLAGHTHGGQVVIPFYGPPITLSSVPRRVAAGGLHRINDNLIYVSRGVGCERGQAPRVRFLCPPEISLVTVGGGSAKR
ncbi:MAG: metallophosphoesterase [Planctomycetota bacterium]